MFVQSDVRVRPQKENEMIEDKIHKLRESYASYQKIESEITTNKKKLIQMNLFLETLLIKFLITRNLINYIIVMENIFINHIIIS